MSALRDNLSISPELSGPALPIKRELSRIQYGQASKYILIEQLPIGFGGQISGRLLALKLALALERKAIFRSHGDPPYLQTFEPQYANAPGEVDWDLAEPFDPLGEQSAAFIRFDYLATAQRLGTVEDQIEDWIHRRVIQRYGINSDANVDGEVLTWMRLLASVRSLVEAEQKRLGVTRATLGVHLRRGDKSVETAYVPAADVNRAIAALHRVWPFTSVFLASDSPDAAEEIDLPPGVALIFDRGEKRYNNANHKMLFQNPELAQQETLTAVKNLNSSVRLRRRRRARQRPFSLARGKRRHRRHAGAGAHRSSERQDRRAQIADPRQILRPQTRAQGGPAQARAATLAPQALNLSLALTHLKAMGMSRNLLILRSVAFAIITKLSGAAMVAFGRVHD